MRLLTGEKNEVSAVALALPADTDCIALISMQLLRCGQSSFAFSTFAKPAVAVQRPCMCMAAVGGEGRRNSPFIGHLR